MTLGTILLLAAVFGVCLVVVQHCATARHLATPPREPVARPPMSILKPLCGIDDELQANLERFSLLDYPEYEVLLGVERSDDPVLRVARACEARWPGRVRVVMRRSEPGLNPKVNQLLSLAAAARHDVLVISDSNVRVDFGYLDEIAAHLDDPRVGLVTHPIAGVGERRMGSVFDALHLAGSVTPGVVAAKTLFRQDIVVGKSMAMRRADLAAIGGFEAFKDVLAEDYAMGRAMRAAGRRVALGNRPVYNVTVTRPLAHFWGRYRRWAVIQRSMVGRPVYAFQAFLNPVPLALAGFALDPQPLTMALLGAITGTKILADAANTRALRGEAPAPNALAWIPVKDVLAFAAFVAGIASSRVEWRGKSLDVGPETRLLPARKGVIQAWWMGSR